MDRPSARTPAWWRTALAVLVAAAVALPAAALAAQTLGVGQFDDVDDGDTHAEAIGWLVDAGVTAGCAPGEYCPADAVTRAQMATFMQRLAGGDGDVAPVVEAAHALQADQADFAAQAGDAETVQGLGPDDLEGEQGPQGPQGPEGPPGDVVDRGAPAGTTATTFDGVGGGEPSITPGADGLPVLAHQGDDLKVSRCTVPDCSEMETTVVDDDSGPRKPSIAIGADGLPIVSYTAGSPTELRVAHCTTPGCEESTVSVLDEAGRGTSIAIGADGLPVVSYRGGDNDLLVAACTDPQCADADLVTVEDSERVGYDTDVAIGADGLPIIVDRDFNADEVRVTHCSEPDCSQSQTEVIADGRSPTVALGDDRLPVISYRDGGQLHVAHCADVACTDGQTSQVRGSGAGRWPSMTIGADGLPLIARATSDGLHVLACHDPACERAAEVLVDDQALSTTVGSEVAITVGADGRPLVAARTDDSSDLYVAQCGSRICTPFQRRR